MSLRSALEPWLLRRWQRRGLLSLLLRPLAWLHRIGRALSAWRWRGGGQRLPVPVLAIGNLYVGGTGKTPLTIALVRALQARGWTPGIVSRGHGSNRATPRAVDIKGTAAEYGDEPLLMAQATSVPVAVGHDRAATGRLLLNLHPRVDVIVADDALQHRRLGRDVELAVVHGRGFGNGLLLPAGPLRDPPQRLAEVDAVVFHDQADLPRPTVRVYSPFFGMRSQAGTVYALKDPSRTVELGELAVEQQRGGLKLLAVCGIGTPERFFGMLRAAGLQFDALALADHYPFTDNPLAGRAFDVALITEKDAVKCRANPVLASDGRLCVVPLAVSLDDGLVDLVERRLRARRATGAVPTAAAAAAVAPAIEEQDGPSPA